MKKFEYKDLMNPKENINVMCSSGDRNCDEHIHEFVELIFIADGDCIHYIDSVMYEAHAGDLLFVNYNQTHSFYSEESIKYYNFLYVPEFFSKELINSENIYEIFSISLFSEFYDRDYNGMQKVSFSGDEFNEINSIAEKMCLEFLEKKPGYNSILNGYSRVLFSKILRRLKTDVEKDSQKYISKIVEECIDYVNSKCFEKISLREIAGNNFYNPAYLSRIFKKHCGITLSDYVKEKRISEACRLLDTTEISVENVMNKVGYSDKKHFYKSFRDITGKTPLEYRKLKE